MRLKSPAQEDSSKQSPSSSLSTREEELKRQAIEEYLKAQAIKEYLENNENREPKDK